jgi:twinkle protein
MNNTLKVASRFVKHVECPHCGSSDANGYYSDGHQYCFACETYTDGDSDNNEPTQTQPKVQQQMSLKIPNTADVRSIADRNITRDTCEYYGVVQETGKHYYPYTDEDGKTVAYKQRNVEFKTFSILGDFKKATLFGQNLFNKSGKYVTIVEGELDALSAFQMTGSKWPVVSIRNGASAALKDVKAQYEWLDSFDSIVICFDSDEPGQKAAVEVAELFGNKAKIVKHIKDCKDASDYLVTGQESAFVNQWWKAETYIPDGIVAASSLWESVSTPEPAAEAFYPFKGLNSLLYGLRSAELITVTAGSGLGKSQFLREIL